MGMFERALSDMPVFGLESPAVFFTDKIELRRNVWYNFFIIIPVQQRKVIEG